MAEEVIELSIIVPVFNGQEYLVSLVDSIEKNNKTISDKIEVLLIDDESTDNSLDCCKELSSQFSNVRYFSKKRGGVGDARNYGLKKSNGKYITFCDQDDIVINGYDEFLRIVKQSNADVLIANYAINKGGTIHYTNSIHRDILCEDRVINDMLKRLFYLPEIIGEKYYSEVPRFYPSIWNCIFRAATIKENEIEVSGFVEYDDDWKLLVDVLSVARGVYLCKNYYYMWNYRPESQSHTGRYLPELTVLRQQLRDYTVEKMQSFSFSEVEKQSVLAFYDKETILKCLMNYRKLSYQDFKRYIGTNTLMFSMKNKVRMLAFCSFKEKLWLSVFFIPWPWLAWLLLKFVF